MSIISSFIYEVTFKIILQKIYFYYTYFDADKWNCPCQTGMNDRMKIAVYKVLSIKPNYRGGGR